MKILKLAFVALVFLVGSSALYAQQMESGKYSLDNTMQNYTLDKQSGDRSMTIYVNFDKGFDKKPKIILSVTKLDAETQTNLRYRVEALSISRDGFSIKVATWNDTKIMGIAGDWLAISEP
jgi:hypothetical protein